MHNMIKHLLWTLLAFAALWCVLLGLSTTAVVFLFKSLLATLVPVLGLATAYLICGVICIVLAIAAALYMPNVRPSAGASSHREEGRAAHAYEEIRLLVREHPLEAVALAFTLGFATESNEDIKRYLLMASKSAA